jgi:mono/diheme cytochrome c family protein
MKKILVSITVITITLAACKHGEKTTTTTAEKPKPVAVDCATASYTYAADIKPIIDQYCAGCHNVNLKAGYNFRDLTYVKKAAENGSLLGTIKNEKGYPHMPATGEQLDPALVSKIECWVNNGMK